MIIKNKKQFALGFFMACVFAAVLVIMFMPIFGEKNAFEASDGLFNSISKASTDRFQALKEDLARVSPKDAAQTLTLPEEVGSQLALMLNKAGASAEYTDGELRISGNLNAVLQHIVNDSQSLFANKTEEFEKTYGLPSRRVGYNWWVYTNTAAKDFKLSKQFESAKILDEVKTKAVEVGYNYFGVDPTPVSERIGIVSFALVFYVFYTLWWGFSIFYLFEGLGLLMTKSSTKQEA